MLLDDDLPLPRHSSRFGAVLLISLHADPATMVGAPENGGLTVYVHELACAGVLMPAICVVGIARAHGLMPLARGAALLYLTNLLGIMLASMAVYVSSGHVHIRRAHPIDPSDARGVRAAIGTFERNGHV